MATRTHVVGSSIGATVKPGISDYELLLAQTDLLNVGITSGMVFTPTGLNVAMTAGRCLNEITNTNLAHGKTYKVFVSADAQNFTIPSGTRTDIIVCQTTIADPDATASNLSTIVHLQGTTTVPANACLLATLTVSGSTVTIAHNPATIKNAFLSILDASNRLKTANLPSLIPIENLGGDSGGDPNLFLNETGAFAAIVPNAVTKLLNSHVSTTVGSTTTKTNLASVSVPGNSLGTNNAIRVKGWVTLLNFTGGSTLTLRAELGAQTIVTLTVNPAGAANLGLGYFEFEIRAAGATNAQDGQGQIMTTPNVIASSSTSVTKQFATGNGTVDTTAAQTLAISAQFSNTVGTITVDATTIELIK